MKQRIDKAKNKLRSTNVFQRLKKWWFSVTMPGFEGVPINKVAIFFAHELQKDKIGPRAAAISFNFLMALFPTLIFIFSLIPIIPVHGLQENIFSLLQSILPNDAFQLARETIEDTISKKRVDLLSIGFLLMIIFTTNGMNAVLKTFSKINPAFKQRNFIREYGVAFLLTIVLAVFFLISMALIIFGQDLIKLLLDELNIISGVTLWILIVVKWILIIMLYFLGVSIIYYIGPALKTKWKFVSIGGTVATILSLLASFGFAFYVNNFGQYNKFYGSLGTFIIIMSWLWINSMVLLLGFELNNSIRLFQLSQEEEFDELYLGEEKTKRLKKEEE